MPPLSPADFARLTRARRDAAFIWAALVDYHRMIRADLRKWPSMLDLAREMTGQTAELGLSLGTQSQNYSFEEFLGVVKTTTENRKTGKAAGGAGNARFPWRKREARDCHWDRRDAKTVKGGFTLGLARERDETKKSGLKRQPPLFIPYRPGIPSSTTAITIHYSATDRSFYILFKIKVKMRKTDIVSQRPHKVMGIDLGQIRLAACTSETGETLNIKGRGLRSIQQGHQKKKAFRRSRIDRKKFGSANRRKEIRKLARFSRKARGQALNLLHTASRRIVNFAVAHGVTHVFIGDPNGVRNLEVGKRQNQANHDWATGRFTRLVSYKGEWENIKTESINERGTTRSCPTPECGDSRKPCGRVYVCHTCDLVAHRDGIGAWNICARGYESIHGIKPRFDPKFVALEGQKYLTPVGILGTKRNPHTRNSSQVVSSAVQPRLSGSIQTKHVTRGKAPEDGMEQVRKNGSKSHNSGDQPAA